jgi:3',5'-cyclic AMP phosphodiesterase CpdA
MLTILHTSDLQVGKPYRPPAAEALIRFIDEHQPDVVVVAGDLTQRAKASEFRIVRALLARFGDIPFVVTPGNHDVPLYRVWERLLFPYRNWKRFIASDLDSVVRVPGATFVALNSSAPRRAIVSGWLGEEQVAFAKRACDESPSGDVRILVVHHHFVATDDRTGGRPLPGARGYLQSFADMGIDLVLGGHVHQTRVIAPDDPRTGAPVALVSTGTTTSRRGRGIETDLNTLNVVQVGEEAIRVVPHRLWTERGAFEPLEPVTIPRSGAVGEDGGRTAPGAAEGSRGGA